LLATGVGALLGVLLPRDSLVAPAAVLAPLPLPLPLLVAPAAPVEPCPMLLGALLVCPPPATLLPFDDDSMLP